MRSRITRFLIVASILMIYTGYRAGQLWPEHPILTAFLAFGLFFAMIGSTIISRGNAGVINQNWFRALSWTGSIGMALWSTFVIFALPLDFLRLLLWTVGLPLSFLSPTLYLGLLGFAVLLTTLGFIETRRGPHIREVRIPVQNLNPALKGLKIVQISDLHVGPTLRKSYVEKIVTRTNKAQADLIVVTGDLADARATSITEFLEPLRGLRARLGIFYVTGNHEYYWDAVGIVQKMAELGFIPLINENRIVDFGGAKILVAGITDPMGQIVKGHAPDATKAAQTQQKTDFKILLAHRPDAFHESEPLGFDLQFSGHTHSGQYFPFNLMIGWFHKYSRGLYQHGRMWVYVNPGTGYWGPANRLGVPAEITSLTLA